MREFLIVIYFFGLLGGATSIWSVFDIAKLQEQVKTLSIKLALDESELSTQDKRINDLAGATENLSHLNTQVKSMIHSGFEDIDYQLETITQVIKEKNEPHT